MKTLHWSLLLLLSVPAVATADTVRLTNGRTIENVRAERDGSWVRLARESGYMTVPADQVLEIVPKELESETLARRRRLAGDDPKALRDLARWCGENALGREKADILTLARGIELDARLEQLRGARTATPFVALAREMRRDGYTETERAFVARLALERDPENAAAHEELGEVRRGDRWVSRAEAARQDARDEEHAMIASGLVQFEGRWRRPSEVAEIERSRRAEEAAATERRAQAEARERRAQAEADLAARTPSSGDAPYRIVAMGSPRSVILRRSHAVHYAWELPHAPVRVPPVRPQHHEAPHGTRDHRAPSSRPAPAPQHRRPGGHR